MDMNDAPTMRPYARHVFICAGKDCNVEQQGEAIYARLGEQLGDLAKLRNPCRVKRGTSPCLGVCEAGPILVVYPEGIWYHHVDEALLQRIVEEHLRNNQPVLSHVFHQLASPDGNEVVNE